MSWFENSCCGFLGMDDEDPDPLAAQDERHDHEVARARLRQHVLEIRDDHRLLFRDHPVHDPRLKLMLRFGLQPRRSLRRQREELARRRMEQEDVAVEHRNDLPGQLDQRTDDQFGFGGRADDVGQPLGGDQFIDRTADRQVVLRELDVLLPQHIDRLLERLDVVLAALDELFELRKTFFQQLRPVLAFWSPCSMVNLASTPPGRSNCVTASRSLFTSSR